jgi:thioredoxin 1
VTLSRVLAELTAEFGDDVVFTEINADDNPRSTIEYRIMATPTVLVFQGGAVVESFVGARPRSAVRELVRRHLANARGATTGPG